MPSSSPSSPSRSSRSSLDAVASTRAPALLAIWMAAIPTPLAPAWMSAVSPAWSRPNSNRLSSAVPKGTGTQAASSVVTPSGTTQQKGSPTARSSAWDPSRPTVTTRSPDCHSAHRWAHGDHRAGALVAHDVGSRHEAPPSRLRVSPPSMLIASTRTSTSSGPTSGSGTSSYRNTSGPPVS